MQTVGEILKTTRIAKGLMLEDIEKRTKIRFKFLEALENDDFTLLPSPTYTRGFIKNYCSFLRLDTNKILALYRRQVDEQKRYKEPSKELAEPLSRSLFHLTPNRVIGIVVGFLLALATLYFGMQYQKLFEPPHLVVEQPLEGARIDEPQTMVFGKTDSDATVVINNATVLVQDGKFFKEVSLSSGVNTVVIEAISRRGKKTTIRRTITVTTAGG